MKLVGRNPLCPAVLQYYCQNIRVRSDRIIVAETRVIYQKIANCRN